LILPDAASEAAPLYDPQKVSTDPLSEIPKHEAEQRNLVRLGSVCKAWHRLCREFLYKRLVLPARPSTRLDAVLLFDALECERCNNAPSWGWWTTRLDLVLQMLKETDEEMVVKALSELRITFPNIRHLFFGGWYRYDSRPPLISICVLSQYTDILRSLTWQGTFSIFYDALSGLPQLDHLEQLALDLQGTNGAVGTLGGEPHCFPSLKRLIICGIKPKIARDLRFLDLPQLEYLELINPRQSPPLTEFPLTITHKVKHLVLGTWPIRDTSQTLDCCPNLVTLEVKDPSLRGRVPPVYPTIVSSPLARLSEIVFHNYGISRGVPAYYAPLLADRSRFPSLKKVIILLDSRIDAFYSPVTAIVSLRLFWKALRLSAIEVVDGNDGKLVKRDRAELRNHIQCH
jgi:hypothetical protein